MDAVLRFIKSLIPGPIFRALQPFYHLFLARAAAAFYLFPSRQLKVIGVTGTNGKSTVVHLIASILEAAGEKTASVSSLRFRINGAERKNTLKMTMPGRFKLQKFLRKAVGAGCKYAVLEVTSEGIKQSRHEGINFYMAVLTNVTPEHLESHGTFDAYRAAKAELFKKAGVHILNGEDPSIEYFLKVPAKTRIVYSKKDLPPDFRLKLKGDFNIENAVAAYHAGKVLGVDREAIKTVLEKTELIPGRMEFIAKDPFAVVVDYAHTPDALRKAYETLARGTDGKLICVLGSAGGGRDKWKRPEMGKIASEFCGEIILTDEDPYDEDPEEILKDMAKGMRGKEYKKISDRKEAIRAALGSAQGGDAVIITGKGAEPWMMLKGGKKIPWDDRETVKEELKRKNH